MFLPVWDDKHRNALVATVILLVLSVLGFCISMAAYTYTTNMKAGAFWAEITVRSSFTLGYLSKMHNHLKCQPKNKCGVWKTTYSAIHKVKGTPFRGRSH